MKISVETYEDGSKSILLRGYEKLQKGEGETFGYGFESFKFLLPEGDTTGNQFADLIEEHYSIENPKTRAIVELFRRLD